MLERDRELERIRRRLRLAREGRGGALAVDGPAGIGKTVMLEAAREAAEDDGFHVACHRQCARGGPSCTARPGIVTVQGWRSGHVSASDLRPQ